MTAASKRARALGVASVGIVVVALSLFAPSAASALSGYSLTGSIPGSGTDALSEPLAVAVDQASHDIYVADRNNYRVVKFDSSGNFILMFGDEVNKTKAELRRAQEAAGERVTVTHGEEDLCTVASGDTCQAAPASTATTCVSGLFSGSAPGDLANPVSIVVDNSGGPSAGDVYVGSTGSTCGGFGGADYVSKFDPSGHVVASWGKSGQVRNGGELEIGHFDHQNGGLAVDRSGNVYFQGVFGGIAELGQGGGLLNSYFAPDVAEPEFGHRGPIVAVDPAGNLYALASRSQDPVGNVRELAPPDLGPFADLGPLSDLGPLTGPGFSGPATAFLRDESTGQSYVADGGSVIRHYDAACDGALGPCHPVESFGAGELGSVQGLAIDESTGVLYAADASENRIEVLAPAPLLPEVTTAPPTSPTATGATLRGHVDPAGGDNVTSCRFEYTSDAAFKAANANEVQTVTLSGATGGAFNLTFEGQTTGATGSGNLTAGSNEVTGVQTFSGTFQGSFQGSEAISGAGIPAGTTFSVTESGNLLLSAKATASGSGVALAAGLPYNSSPEGIQFLLEKLSSIGTHNLHVTGSQGGPWEIEFVNAFARTDVPAIGAASSLLTPPGATAAVSTTTVGGDGWQTAETAACQPTTPYSEGEDVHADVSGLTPETAYRFRLAAQNSHGTEASPSRTFTPHVVVGLTTEPPADLSGEDATLKGSLLGDGTPSHYRFQWGRSQTYDHETALESAGSPSGPGLTPLSARTGDLTPTTIYHYRVVAENGASEVSDGEDQSFKTPPNAPQVTGEAISEVHSDSAVFHAQINPEYGDTTYKIEYVTAEQFETPGPEGGFAQAETAPGPDVNTDLGAHPVFKGVSVKVFDLLPATTYHIRAVAENANGANVTAGAGRTFTTFRYVPVLNDPCPNAHVRQQTGAAQLLDCRAYELVSAANTAGYDVESNVVPGQAPFVTSNEAEDRVLYGVHDGGIPGTNHPTNRGVDPYVATRGEAGWSTEYVGVPANNPFSSAPFSSAPSGSDSVLDTFAFGGPGGCSPCFEEGFTGIPVRLPDGELVQGMVASAGLDPQPGPGATVDGRIAKDLSANGEHLIFGSTTLFAQGGNDETGDVSIYDHDLETGETHVVSNTPNSAGSPEPLPCLQGAGKCNSAEGDGNGISELDISSDGSRIVLGQKVSEDAKGNPYYHLYIDVNDSIRSIDLTPGTTSGVLYDGMTADGSKVFFTTTDQLTGDDEDQSADIYEAEVSQSGATLTRISTGAGAGPGGPGNSDGCHPVENSAHVHWNSVGPEENCGVVAIGGGGGVASGDGTAFFLSPEKLDGSSNGVPNAPNLYVARPGEAPRFIATLQSALDKPHPPKLRHDFKSNFGAFSKATALAVDHQGGYVYVLDAGENTVKKFDLAGNPVDFTAGAGKNTNVMTGAETPAGSFSESFFGLVSPSSLAVDPANGDFYVPDAENGVVDKFKPSGEIDKSFGNNGAISASAPTGVAVDPATGDLYVSYLFAEVHKFHASGTPVSSFFAINEPANEVVLPLGIAVDSSGKVYLNPLDENTFAGKATDLFESNGHFLKVLDPNPTSSMVVDTSNNDVYIDEGPRIARYDSAGNRGEILSTPNSSEFSESLGVTIDPEGDVYASDLGGTKVAIFEAALAPDQRVDNPAVVDSVSSPETRHRDDFQVTPSGDFAAFPTTRPVAGAGEENEGHTEVYRYDAEAGSLACVSCSPTGQPASGDANLTPSGSSLTSDGRVFFTSADPLANADSDNRDDAYEWELLGTGSCRSESPTFGKESGACLGLVSAGTGAFDSGLLSVSANARDAYIFTRDSLAPQDENGPTMKIYDARVEGGFPFDFPAVGCRASDECHGPSSSVPAPIQVGSATGAPRNFKCEPGFVLRHGRCVRKPHKHRHRHRHHRRSKGHTHTGRKHGGGK